MDFSPLWLSLKVTAVSTALTFFLGIAAAHIVARLNRIAKGLADSVLTLPMILPPTVVGFFLLKLLGLKSPLGAWLDEALGFRFVFTWYGAVAASTVVAFPLMYRAARGAFEQLDSSLVDSAKTLGMRNAQIFWRIIIPNCRFGISAGAILAFARGLGEFGATMMLAGNLPGRTTTISTAVYAAMAAGSDDLAYKYVIMNLAISFFAIFLMNFVNRPFRRKTKQIGKLG